MAENPSTANPVRAAETGAQEGAKVSPRIMMQAGAYYMLMTPKPERHFMETVGNATKKGYDILKEGGKAIDAVEKAVRILEENENFNAGKGSFLNTDGEVECDALIMDGSTMDAGAVMAVRGFKHPITLCRKIMDYSPHRAFSADGALAFASTFSKEIKENELGICDPKSLITDYAKKVKNIYKFEHFVDEHVGGNAAIEHEEPPNSDTVSAVALDSEGRFACATSTGGLPGKMKGRISDAPLVGCGGYANKFGAATTSGHGEALMRMTLASRVVFNMEKLGQDAQTATSNAVQEMESCINGRGCAIAIDKNGNFGKAANSSLIVWAKMADDKLEFGMDGQKTYKYKN